MKSEVIDIAKRASEEILKIYKEVDLGVEYKEDNSPLTKADKASNLIITEKLSTLTPGIPIVSEESENIPFEERKAWDKFWLVDPLDGTKEFIKKNGEFTVNIALIENSSPSLGVVAVPAEGLIYHGSKGEGAFKLDVKKEKEEKIEPFKGKRQPIVAVSRSHLSEKTQKMLENMKAEVISAGSALKFSLVAEGKADLYARLGPTWEWDAGAGHALVEASGAIVCNLEGNPLCYNKENLKNDGFFVCSPLLKENALSEIRKVL